jgi:hypothetical protein
MTCYIDKRNYDIEMSYDMLYRHEKLLLIQSTSLKPFPKLQPNCMSITISLRWFASIIQNVLMALSLAINLVRLW